MGWFERFLLWGAGLSILGIATSAWVAIIAATWRFPGAYTTARWWFYVCCASLLTVCCMYIVRLLWEDLK